MVPVNPLNIITAKPSESFVAASLRERGKRGTPHRARPTRDNLEDEQEAARDDPGSPRARCSPAGGHVAAPPAGEPACEKG